MEEKKHVVVYQHTTFHAYTDSTAKFRRPVGSYRLDKQHQAVMNKVVAAMQAEDPASSFEYVEV